MLTIILRTRCRLCSSVTKNMQMLENVKYYGFLNIHLDDVKQNTPTIKYSKAIKKTDKKKFRKPIHENIKEIKAVLAKYNIPTCSLNDDSKIFRHKPWVIDQRIMILQELGITKITSGDIENFRDKMYLPVYRYKTYLGVKPDTDLSKNLFSWINKNSNFTKESLTNFDENNKMILCYKQCIFEYLKSELHLNDNQMEDILRKRRYFIINSFRLLNKLVKLLKNHQFTEDLIVKNYFLLRCHPENVEKIFNLIGHIFQGDYYQILLKNPKVLNTEPKNIEVLLSYFEQYKIKTEMIRKYHQILLMNAKVFKYRAEMLSKLPGTRVYLRHPKFLVLIRRYTRVFPRVHYLESKNFKYSNIYSLVYYNNVEQQITHKKTTALNLKSFCDSIFGDDINDLILRRLKDHPYIFYVPIVQMYETYEYLKEIFSDEIIYKHAYALAYAKIDLEVARENVLKEPEYHNLSPEEFLEMCIYKIEEKNNFSGEAVLTPGRYAEIANEDGKIRRDSKEN